MGSGRSGLKQALDDDGHVIVELFRNCVCGSTLMDCFRDRRDTGEAGLRRQAGFGGLIAALVAQGLERKRAHAELLKVLRGEPRAILMARPRSGGSTGRPGMTRRPRADERVWEVDAVPGAWPAFQ